MTPLTQDSDFSDDSECEDDPEATDKTCTSSSCCCPCSERARAITRCPCQKGGIHCSSCLPLTNGKCCNKGTNS